LSKGTQEPVKDVLGWRFSSRSLNSGPPEQEEMLHSRPQHSASDVHELRT